MGRAEDIDLFFRTTGQSVFIEVEGLKHTIEKFILNYNSNYSPAISIGDVGVVCMSEEKDKWGLELRCYFNDCNGFPYEGLVTTNPIKRHGYFFRFNDLKIINELFNLGYRIGRN